MAKRRTSNDRKMRNKREVKPNSKRAERGRDRDEAEVSSTKSKDNDPSWYAENEWLLRDAASLPFSNRAGMPFGLSLENGTSTVTFKLESGSPLSKHVFPGVCGIACSSVPGVDTGADSPLNVAARNIYSFVRFANSGHANYDAPNLMIYLLAMDSLYSAYSHCARMYGLIRTYSLRNANLPRALFAACGWDYDDFMYNQVQFRYWLNTIAQKIGSMCVPASMTYMMRHMWMYQNVFADCETSKANFYMYYPYDMYVYSPTGTTNDNLQDQFASSPDTPGLTSVAIGYGNLINHLGGDMTFDKLRSTIDKAIESIMSSEDLGIMSGDILKAFGAEHVWRLVPIHEDFVIVPVYSEEVLTQIHNSKAVGFPNWTTGTGQTGRSVYTEGYPISAVKELVDTQAKKSWLVSPTSFHVGGAYAPLTDENFGQLLNMHKDEVSPGDVMVATRLTAVTKAATQPIKVPGESTTPTTVTARGSVPIWTGSDIVRGYVLVTNRWLDDGRYYPRGVLVGNVLELSSSPTVAELSNALRGLSRWAPFEHHPLQCTAYINVSTGPSTTVIGNLDVYGMQFDVENWTVVTPEILKRMHETALLSQFAVPLMGAWNSKV